MGLRSEGAISVEYRDLKVEFLPTTPVVPGDADSSAMSQEPTTEETVAAIMKKREALMFHSS